MRSLFLKRLETFINAPRSEQAVTHKNDDHDLFAPGFHFDDFGCEQNNGKTKTQNYDQKT
jgi:hypothetical protein